MLLLIYFSGVGDIVVVLVDDDDVIVLDDDFVVVDDVVVEDDLVVFIYFISFKLIKNPLNNIYPCVNKKRKKK
jgi:hypothetical protein